MKYMGSKSRVAKDICPIIQEYIDDNNIDTYIEPFVGGANIIDKIKCNNKIGYDKNKYLIALLNKVKDETADNRGLYSSVPRSLYNEARIQYRTGKGNMEDWQIGNIGFLASYNGRFFDGGYAQTGVEKTKYGERVRNYYKESLNNLLTQSPDLKNIFFEEKDFFSLKEIKGSLIYLDPPYRNTKEYENSKEFKYESFYEKIRELGEDNIVIISEQWMPEEFKCIWEKNVKRTIKVDNKRKATEKLFIYKKEK